MLSERGRRENRGTNMSLLIADVVQQGDKFWANEDWKGDEEGSGGEESDSSFDEEPDKPDVFDSDFNDTEESGSDEDGSDVDTKKPDQIAVSFIFIFKEDFLGC
jgi:hypothetical protein